MQALKPLLLLFPLLCCAKNATQWKDLNQNPIPNPSEITIFESSILQLNVGEGGGEAIYGGNLLLNHDLRIEGKITALTDPQSNATSIYQSFQGTKEITGAGKLTFSLTQAASIPIKSIINLQHSTLLLGASTQFLLAPQSELFSLIRVGQGGVFHLEGDFEADTSQSIGKFNEGLKPIFDIDTGRVDLNTQEKHTLKLKGDIFSSGIFNAHFTNSLSFLEGNFKSINHAQSALFFSRGARGKINFSLGDSSILELMLNAANLDSTLQANALSHINLESLRSKINLALTLSNHSSASLNVKNNSDFQGSILSNSSAPSSLSLSSSQADLSLSLQSNASFSLSNLSSNLKAQFALTQNALLGFQSQNAHNTLTLQTNDNAQATLNLQNSSITLSTSANTNSAQTLLLKDTTLNLTGNLSANSIFKIQSTQSTLHQVLELNNHSYLESLSQHSSAQAKLTLRHTSSLLLSLQDHSTLKALIDTQETLSINQINVSNSTLKAKLLGNQISIALTQGGSYLPQEDANLQTLSLHNAAAPSNEDLLSPTPIFSHVDLRFKDYGETLRSHAHMDLSTSKILRAQSIEGENGLFRLYGIFNESAWGKDEKGNLIASDRIITSKLVGKHYIQILWDPSNFDPSLAQSDLQSKHIVIAKQEGNQGGGDFLGAKSIIGVYELNNSLKKIPLKDAVGEILGYEWILDSSPPSPPKPSIPTRLLHSILKIPSALLLNQNDTFHARLGDLREISQSNNVWIKTQYALTLIQETPQNIASTLNYGALFLGFDYNFFTPQGRSFIGGAIHFSPSHSQSKNKRENLYEGNGMGYGLALYYSFLFHWGFYLDSVLNYTLQNFHFSSPHLLSDANFLSHSLKVSLEIGEKFRLPISLQDFNQSFYYLKPHLNLAFSWNAPYSLNVIDENAQSLNAHLSSAFPTQLKASLDFGKRFLGEKIKGDFFVGANMQYTFSPTGDFTISSAYNSIRLKDKGLFNLGISGGGNIIFNEALRIYFEGETQFLGEIQPILKLNLGLRWIIGASTQTTIFNSYAPLQLQALDHE